MPCSFVAFGGALIDLHPPPRLATLLWVGFGCVPRGLMSPVFALQIAWPPSTARRDECKWAGDDRIPLLLHEYVLRSLFFTHTSFWFLMVVLEVMDQYKMVFENETLCESVINGIYSTLIHVSFSTWLQSRQPWKSHLICHICLVDHTSDPNPQNKHQGHCLT